VSITLKSPASASWFLRVVPGTGLTAAMSSFLRTNWLNSVDFPTLAGPTTAIRSLVPTTGVHESSTKLRISFIGLTDSGISGSQFSSSCRWESETLRQAPEMISRAGSGNSARISSVLLIGFPH
jgi:hypothetical protein